MTLSAPRERPASTQDICARDPFAEVFGQRRGGVRVLAATELPDVLIDFRRRSRTEANTWCSLRVTPSELRVSVDHGLRPRVIGPQTMTFAVTPQLLIEVFKLPMRSAGADNRVELGEHDRLVSVGLGAAAPYAVCLGFRIRYVLDLNAREAMQLIELRSGSEGHPDYRAVAQEMHHQITRTHPTIGAAMVHVDESTEPRLERVLSEIRNESKLDARRIEGNDGV